jgi:hypothetical protein
MWCRKGFYVRKVDSDITVVKRLSKIRPLVTHGCETWVFKETIKSKLMVFERKILSKFFGHTKERESKQTMN